MVRAVWDGALQRGDVGRLLLGPDAGAGVRGAPSSTACWQDSKVYVALGTGNDIASYDFSTSTYDSSFYADSADLIGIENGIVLWVRSAQPWKIVNTGSWISTAGTGQVGSAWCRSTGTCGRCRLASIVRYTTASATTATVVGEATMPDFAADDDFDWAINHFGKLWTWAGKEVVYYDTADNEFVGTGIRGQATRGACTVGSWLVVVIDDLVTGDPEMWAYDGRGWWQLEDGSTAYDRPVSIFGSCDDADMLSGRGTTNQHAATWQFFDRSGAPAIRSTYELITALLDAGERDLDKVWRRAGVEIATPDDRATADSVTVALSYSVDGGANWTSVASSNLTNASGRLNTVSAALSARPESRFIQLKLAVSSVSAWCPVVVGLWAEHETMDLPTRRRRWRFTVEMTDQVIKRDSSVDSTGARTLAINLWDVWDNGSVVTFKDVDYDQTTTSYNVRIAGIREVIKKLTDVSIASSEVELTLVEV